MELSLPPLFVQTLDDLDDIALSKRQLFGSSRIKVVECSHHFGDRPLVLDGDRNWSSHTGRLGQRFWIADRVGPCRSRRGGLRWLGWHIAGTRATRLIRLSEGLRFGNGLLDVGFLASSIFVRWASWCSYNTIVDDTIVYHSYSYQTGCLLETHLVKRLTLGRERIARFGHARDQASRQRPP